MLFEQFTLQSKLLKEIEKKVRRSTKNKGNEPTLEDLQLLTKLANENQETAIVLKVLWVRLFRSKKKYLSIYRTLLVTEFILLHGKDTLISQIEYFKPKIKKLQNFKSTRWQLEKGLIGELRREIQNKKHNTSRVSSSSTSNQKKRKKISQCLSDDSSTSFSKNEKKLSQKKQYSEDEDYYIHSSSSSESELLLQDKKKRDKDQKTKLIQK
ncbi:hypothetical protein M0813_22786 [Anaeramoeba flamelloides]|uniref:ENTH domain-containing protein n=1 Tax=Anaeramoeba flamelloides TaxID=1746091 RepID=A0ABQ8YBQ3_9EUKA|nr:hypothetical protein M0813_22786 [Anaeramoeba flamelloides]